MADQINIPLGQEAGVPYGYLEYKPTGANRILIHLHGHGERGNGKDELYRVRRNGLPKQIDEGKYTRSEFIVLSPQYLIESSMAYHSTLNRFCQKMALKYNIPMTEIYMIGLSGGANSIFNYIVNYSHIKAAVAISGGGPYSKANLAISTRLWALHGENDAVINPLNSKRFVDNYNLANPRERAIFTLFPFEGHSSYVWEKTYAQSKVYDWLLKH